MNKYVFQGMLEALILIVSMSLLMFLSLKFLPVVAAFALYGGVALLLFLTTALPHFKKARDLKAEIEEA